MNTENTDTMGNTKTEIGDITGTTENTENPASDIPDVSITDNTTSDLPVDLPSLTRDAVDLDNSEQDHMEQDSSDSTLLKLAEVRIIRKFRKNNSFVYFSQKTNGFVSIVYKLFVSKV